MISCGCPFYFEKIILQIITPQSILSKSKSQNQSFPNHKVWIKPFQRLADSKGGAFGRSLVFQKKHRERNRIKTAGG